MLRLNKMILLCYLFQTVFFLTMAFSQNVDPYDDFDDESEDTLAVYTKIVTDTLTPDIVNQAFAPGEFLVFDVKYGIIKAGTATMQIRDMVRYKGKNAYHIQTTAHSAKAFNVFYPVRDTVYTYLDSKKFHSLKFAKKLREGRYYFDLNAEYSQKDGKVFVEKIRYYDSEATKIKKHDSLVVDIPYGVLDVLASFYKIRVENLEVGKAIYFTNHDNKKIYDLKVNVLKKETIRVPAGKFKCIKLEPRLKGDAIFKQKGRLWVWVTDDQYKIPVKMSSKVAVGSITTNLSEIKNGPDVIPARIK